MHRLEELVELNSGGGLPLAPVALPTLLDASPAQHHLVHEIRLWIQAVHSHGLGQATALLGPTTRTQTGRHRRWQGSPFVSLVPEARRRHRPCQGRGTAPHAPKLLVAGTDAGRTHEGRSASFHSPGTHPFETWQNEAGTLADAALQIGAI